MAVGRGLRLVEGSRRLIFLHWGLALVAALPGWTVGRPALVDAVGRRPYFTDAPDPLPLAQVQYLLKAVPGAVWGALAAGLVLACLGRFALTAAAVELLDPNPERWRVRVWRAVWDRGVVYVLPYLRIAVVSALLLAVGAVVLGFASDVLRGLGEDRGWSARSMSIRTPFWLMLAFLGWAGGVGVFAFWARVLIVADRRRRVVQVFPSLVRLSGRRPLAFMAFHWVVSIASLMLAARVLLAWRQSPSGGGVWFAVWLGVLLLQAFVWHWRLRVCLLVRAEEEIGDIPLLFPSKPQPDYRY